MRTLCAATLIAAVYSAAPGAYAMVQDTVSTPTQLSHALAAKPEGDMAEKLAGQVKAWFGNDLISRPGVKVDEREVAWAIEAPNASNAPAVVSSTGRFRQPLQRIGGTNVYAFATRLDNGAAMQWAFDVDG